MKNAQLETLFDCLDNAVAMYVDARSGLVIRKCVHSLEDVIVLSNKWLQCAPHRQGSQRPTSAFIDRTFSKGLE